MGGQRQWAALSPAAPFASPVGANFPCLLVGNVEAGVRTPAQKAVLPLPGETHSSGILWLLANPKCIHGN